MGISSSASGLRPGVCTSTTRPTNPYTGQIIFETDTGYLRVWDGSAWDYLSQWQAATTNLPVSDLGAWTTYTPTWTNVTVGNATQTFRYSVVNKIGVIRGVFTLGSTSSITGSVIFSLPSGWTVSDDPISSQTRLGDTGVANFDGFLLRWSDTQLLVGVGLVNGTYLGTSGATGTVPFTWGNTDVISVGAVLRLS